MSDDTIAPGVVPDEHEEVKALASQLVNTLLDRGMTPQDIAESMNHRVSARTIYRWAKGESGPQQTSGLILLQNLVDQGSSVAPEPKDAA